MTMQDRLINFGLSSIWDVKSGLDYFIPRKKNVN